MTRIVFCAALPLEVKAFCARLGAPVPNWSERVRRVRAPFGEGECWIAVSGVGASNMERMLRETPIEPVDCWISMGLAGGLRPGLKVGDVLHGTVVLRDEACSLPVATLPESIDGSILYCSKKPLCAVEEKRSAFEQTGADAVDMESGAVAQWAHQRKERFSFIRVISDGALEPIDPNMMRCLNEDGLPSVQAALAMAARKPWLLPAMMRMGFRSSRLSARLADAAFELARRLVDPPLGER